MTNDSAGQCYLQHNFVMKGDPGFPCLLDEAIITALGLLTSLKIKNGTVLRSTNDLKRLSLPMLTDQN